jgi:sugar phosphate isomerase/epimerase
MLLTGKMPVPRREAIAMKTMKGPGIFLAQFLRDQPPYDNLENIGRWAAELGYKGVQIPTWDPRVIDLDQAAKSKDYCDDLKGMLSRIGLEITELAAHLQGQVLAMHPAYEVAWDAWSYLHLWRNDSRKGRQP